MRDFLFSYDDILLQPKHSFLKSRSDADTSVNFLGQKFRLPIVPANMEDVINRNNALMLSENEYFYIFHRFGKYGGGDPIHSFIGNANDNKWKLISASIGVSDNSLSILTDIHNNNYRVDYWTIDVAHADHENVKPVISFLKRNFPSTKIIAGNVATADGYKYLCDLGVDAVKVGIGGGSICTTRYKTGFHIPTAYSVWDCATNGDRDVPIIADGGAKHFGDVAKALVLGADMVMSGRWFAECLDSPAKIEHGKKIYRGSTSFDFKKLPSHIEGQTIQIEEGCSYADRLEEIKQALQSSISYSGGKDLSSFNNVEWYFCNYFKC